MNEPKTSVSRALLEEGTADTMCWNWNLLTDPAKLRTDEQHAQARVDARVIREALARRFVLDVDYYETDSGRLRAK